VLYLPSNVVLTVELIVAKKKKKKIIEKTLAHEIRDALLRRARCRALIAHQLHQRNKKKNEEKQQRKRSAWRKLVSQTLLNHLFKSHAYQLSRHHNINNIKGALKLIVEDAQPLARSSISPDLDDADRQLLIRGN
jgi:hypothetical protein